MAIAKPETQKLTALGLPDTGEEMNDERLELLMRSPHVTVHRRPPGPVAPYVPTLRVKEGTDVMDLLPWRNEDYDETADTDPNPLSP